MGWVQNLWHGKGHETFDQLALVLAQDTKQRMAALRTEGREMQDAVDQALDEVAMSVRELQARGMNLLGLARLLKSYGNALVMLGLSRELASQLKSELRRRVVANR